MPQAKRRDEGIKEIAPNSYLVRIKWRSSSGIPHELSKTVHGNITKARTVRKELEAKAEEGRRLGESITLGAHLDDWLKDGESRWSPKTRAEYKRKIEKNIRPALGLIPLRELTAKNLDDFYRELEEEGLSASSIRHFHGILSSALNKAEKWDLIDRVPTRRATPPRIHRVQKPIPSKDEVHQIIEYARTTNAPIMGTILFVAASTGMRRGEICGLKWSDVDFLKKEIGVRRSIVHADGLLSEKLPKSNVQRKVFIGEEMVNVLGLRKNEASEDAQLFDVELSEDAFVFSLSPDSAFPMNPDNVTQNFVRFMKDLRLQTKQDWPYRLHDLRHHAATEGLNSNSNARITADRLGHKNPSITQDTYGHGDDDLSRLLANDLEAGLWD